jgi:hypothetical protein
VGDICSISICNSNAIIIATAIIIIAIIIVSIITGPLALL